MVLCEDNYQSVDNHPSTGLPAEQESFLMHCKNNLFYVQV